MEKNVQPRLTTTKKDVGTGLGLWVSKEIVEKLCGTIKASSAGKGQGATFSVIFPFYIQEPASIAVSATTHHTGDAG